ncbi:MAG TPA: hypothetical protein VI159_07830 [Gemmatimonadales bacterium]
MSHTFRIAVLLGALCVVTSAAAQTNPAAQKSETTTVQTTQKSGVIETVYGNHVVLKDADGTTHEYTVPQDFKFQMNGKPITVADLRPGMKVDATFTKETTTHEVTLTRNVTGQVAQVAPGGIVVRDSSGKLTSYAARDWEGNDLTILRPGRELPWRPEEIGWQQLRVGDKLNATIVTTLPPKVVTKQSMSANVTPATEPGATGTGGSSPTEPSTTPPPAK